MLILLFKIGLQLFRNANESAVERRLMVEWYTYVDIAVVCLFITAIALWFRVFIRTK